LCGELDRGQKPFASHLADDVVAVERLAQLFLQVSANSARILDEPFAVDQFEVRESGGRAQRMWMAGLANLQSISWFNCPAEGVFAEPRLGPAVSAAPV
jgi:hypothetical protein